MSDEINEVVTPSTETPVVVEVTTPSTEIADILPAEVVEEDPVALETEAPKEEVAI